MQEQKIKPIITLFKPYFRQKASHIRHSKTLSVYNLQGIEVASLVNGTMKAGYHSVVWNANAHASGVYFVKMIAGEYMDTQKLMLIK